MVAIKSSLNLTCRSKHLRLACLYLSNYISLSLSVSSSASLETSLAATLTAADRLLVLLLSASLAYHLAHHEHVSPKAEPRSREDQTSSERQQPTPKRPQGSSDACKLRTTAQSAAVKSCRTGIVKSHQDIRLHDKVIQSISSCVIHS